ncbi:DNA-binding protein [Neomegalonema sp.]|uniref:DNA-binding protein n=1 Tax=Neomegalonema sp. TaxID=2039713 RepID=UPI00261502D3|nr:DNA-binding protein [Neomegalonema sp.]MDD2869747.1 DNA-binding protein [Neomegalonema sp.]
MNTKNENPASAGTAKLCLPPHLRKPRLRREEAVEYLGLVHGLPIAKATLAKLASVGGGPAYNVSVRTPLYPTGELDRWAEERLGGLRGSTSSGG